ncbi:MAG TPA: hypothetical protein VGX68_14205 [Thermoanaerobaculia bacterium]|nr:hypothetical protein [Thermoanaerobaculia bacterium]
MSAQTSHKSLVPAWVMKVISTATVLWSLVWAALGHEGALKLWIEAPLSLALIYGTSIGANWVRDILIAFAERKSGRAPTPAEA